MKLSLRLTAALALALSPAAFAASAPQPQLPPEPGNSSRPDFSIESAVGSLIPEGFTSAPPVNSKLGQAVRKSYFIYKKPGKDARGYFVPPLQLVETIDGKVVTNEKLGSDWGWTAIRPARSVGMGDPHHDLELREFTNGLEARIIGFSDGHRLQIAREGKPAEPFHVRPVEGYDVQVGHSDHGTLLVETYQNKTTVYTLKGATFSVDPNLTKLASTRGVNGLTGFYSAWSSRTSGLPQAKADEPKGEAPKTEPAKTVTK